MTPPGKQGAVHSADRTLMSSTVPLGSFAGSAAGSVTTGLFGVAAGFVVVLTIGGLCASLSAVLMRPVTRDLSWRSRSESAENRRSDVG